MGCVRQLPWGQRVQAGLQVLQQVLQLAGIKWQAPLCCCLQALQGLFCMRTLLLLQAVLEGGLGTILLVVEGSVTTMVSGVCCMVYQLLQRLLLALQQPLMLRLCRCVVVGPEWRMCWWQDTSRGPRFIEQRHLCEAPQGSMGAEGGKAAADQQSSSSSSTNCEYRCLMISKSKITE
jgi:hypothetical protein